MRTRQHRIEFCLNDKEYDHLKKQLELTGLSQSSLLRQLIMDADVKARPPDEYIKIYRLVSNMANNINQIAHVANATGFIHPEQITAASLTIEKCWKYLKELR